MSDAGGRTFRPLRSGSAIDEARQIVRAVSEIRFKGTTAVAAPRAIASFGIPKTTQLDSSWAMVAAPRFLISNKP